MKYTKEEFSKMTEHEYYSIRDIAANKLAIEFRTAIDTLIDKYPNLANTLDNLGSDLLSEDDVENAILKK